MPHNSCHSAQSIPETYYHTLHSWQITQNFISSSVILWFPTFPDRLPYLTDYKTHFFLRKIASKIQVHLIFKINIKMSSVWLKIPASLKNGHNRCRGKPISIWQYWTQLAAAVHRCDEYELRGFTSLLTLSPSHPANTNPEHCRAYVASLCCTVPVNLNWKWFVLSVTVQYFC